MNAQCSSFGSVWAPIPFRRSAAVKILWLDCQLFRVALLAINYNRLITSVRFSGGRQLAAAPQSLIKYHVNAFQ